MRSRTAGLVTALSLLLAGCADTTPDNQVPPAVTPGPRPVYVAVGASDSVGVGAEAPARDAWTMVFFRKSLPDNTEFVNLAVSGSTVEGALISQLPIALKEEPTIVTVWLNVNDLAHQVPVSTYERQLQELVRGLRRGGRTVVLVANTPPLDHLPAVRVRSLPIPVEEINSRVAAYNESIERVVMAEGAQLVDLHTAALAAREEGDQGPLISDDGFHPSTEGHAEIARIFGLAYKDHQALMLESVGR